MEEPMFEKIIERINSCRGIICNGLSCNSCKYINKCFEGDCAEDKALDIAIEVVNEFEKAYRVSKAYRSQNLNKAIVAGSFDPFTNGHLELVRKAAKIFDEVVVVIGVNAKKTRTYNKTKMKDAINKTLQNEGLSNCVAVCVDGPIALYCAENEIKYTVRGLRNDMDFHYESEIAKTNKLINEELETVYLPSHNDAISSSLVREFRSFGLPVNKFVPKEVLEIL